MTRDKRRRDGVSLMLSDNMMNLETPQGLTRAILEARRYVEADPEYASQIIGRVCDRCPEYHASDFLGADWPRHQKNLEVAAQFIPENPVAVRGVLYFFYSELQMGGLDG